MSMEKPDSHRGAHAPVQSHAPLHWALFLQQLYKVALCPPQPSKQLDAQARVESIWDLEALANAHKTSKRQPPKMQKIRTASVDHFMAYIKGKVETGTDFIFLDSKITADGGCSHLIKKMFAPWEKSYDKPMQHIKKQRRHFANKGL